MAVVWIIPFFVAPGLIEPDDGYAVYGREVTQGEQSSGYKTLAPDIREARRHECIIGGEPEPPERGTSATVTVRSHY